MVANIAIAFKLLLKIFVKIIEFVSKNFSPCFFLILSYTQIFCRNDNNYSFFYSILNSSLLTLTKLLFFFRIVQYIPQGKGAVAGLDVYPHRAQGRVF